MKAPLLERLMKYVDKTDTHWLWTGYAPDRYGVMSGRVRGQNIRVHRAMWEE